MTLFLQPFKHHHTQIVRVIPNVNNINVVKVDMGAGGWNPYSPKVDILYPSLRTKEYIFVRHVKRQISS